LVLLFVITVTYLNLAEDIALRLEELKGSSCAREGVATSGNRLEA